jgi:hypothetical protein
MSVNMSYCRCQSTLEALREVCEHVQDPTKLSPEEQRAYKKLVRLCKMIADDNEDES